jgi:hypothetical protein
MKLYDVRPIFENAEPLTPEAFPLLSSAIPESRKASLEKLLGLFRKHLEDGELIKSEFNELKYINRRIEEAVSKLISEPYFHSGKWESLPEHIRDLDTLNVALHTIPGKLKKAEKLQAKGDHKVLQTYIKLMKELLPLSEAQKKLKPMIVAKRTADVKKAEEKVVRQETLLSHEDVKRVRKVLTDITNKLREETLASNYNYLVKVVERHMAQYDPADPKTSNYGRNARNPFVRGIMNKALEPAKHREPEKLKEDWKDAIKAEAKKMTDDVLDHFINKQTAKLAEILVKKDSLKTIEMKDARAGSGVVEGLLRLTFDDDSAFDVNNKLVWSISKLGKQFYRFPTTFHNVIMADGRQLSGKASENRMKDEFAAEVAD